MIFGLLETVVLFWYKITTTIFFKKLIRLLSWIVYYYIFMCFVVFFDIVKNNYLFNFYYFHPTNIFNSKLLIYIFDNYKTIIIIFLFLCIIKLKYDIRYFKSLIKEQKELIKSRIKRTITLEEASRYWLSQDRIEVIGNDRPIIKLAIMESNDEHVKYFAHMTLKKLIEEREIEWEDALIITDIIFFLQEVASDISSISHYAQDSNIDYQRNVYSTGQTYYDIYSQISLLDHSLNVAKMIIEDEEVRNNFKLGSAVIAALAHDIGKINFSNSNFVWAKDENFQKIIHQKTHEVISKFALDKMIRHKYSFNNEKLEQLHLVYEAIELHHTRAIDKNNTIQNILIDALKRADHKARKNELELYSNNKIRLLKNKNINTEEKTIEKIDTKRKLNNNNEIIQTTEDNIKHNDIVGDISEIFGDTYEEDIVSAIKQYKIPIRIKELDSKEKVCIAPNKNTELRLDKKVDILTTNLTQKELNIINNNDKPNETNLFLAYQKYKENNLIDSKVIVCINGDYERIVRYIESLEDEFLEILVHSNYKCIFTSKKRITESKIKNMISKSEELKNLQVVFFKLDNFANQDEFILKVNLTIQNAENTKEQVLTYKPIIQQQSYKKPDESKILLNTNLDFKDSYIEILNMLAKYINKYNKSMIYSIAYKDTILFNELTVKNIIYKYFKRKGKELDEYFNSFIYYLDKKGYIEYVSTKNNYFSYTFSIIHNKEVQIFKAVPIIIQKAYSHLSIIELNKRSNDEYLTKLIIKEGDISQ